MGVGGNFWDLLKPFARTEGFDFLRDKRVAVDLSYWIVQHETAIKGYARKPHLRLTFFRTINLLSKFGAFPVFVADGTPSPLKSQARIMRFFQASGMDLSGLPLAEGTSVERNRAFLKCVQECLELLELFGVPVLKASGEAEGLCAQLNREGHVDACITSDSDAFLFGAKCIIKRLKPNSEEPFECYQMSDIEAGLGLKRKQLIAIALLVGNDHDLKGVQGIGLDTAFRFVKSFSEDEIFDRLHEIGRGSMLQLQASMYHVSDFTDKSDEKTAKTRSPHCSLCGHPGTKSAHVKYSCERCSSRTSKGCVQKPVGFKCDCSSCDLDKKEKEQKKNETWQMKVCKKIATEQNFPNDAIIEIYLSNNNGHFADAGPIISWKSPNTELLVDYAAYQLNWEPSYVRQKLFPALSTIFLREMASNQKIGLLYGQYEFDSIQRVRTRFGHQFYVVNWKKAAQTSEDPVYAIPSEEPEVEEDEDKLADVLDEPDVTNVREDPVYAIPSEEPEVEEDEDKLADVLDEPDVTNVRVDNGCLMTDENMDLVKAAYPEKVNEFMRQKELKEMKSRKKTSLRSPSTPENKPSSTSKSVQLNITEFYRSSKLPCQRKDIENSKESDKDNCSSKGKRNTASPNLSKSVRRRLLFG